jgi:quinol monooxygenase YgiN
MSVHVIVEMTVKPEKFEEAEGIFKAALKATREWEGCSSVEVFSSKGESKYFFIEKFESEAQWIEYFAWREKESGAVLQELLSTPMKKTFTNALDFGYESK